MIVYEPATSGVNEYVIVQDAIVAVAVTLVTVGAAYVGEPEVAANACVTDAVDPAGAEAIAEATVTVSVAAPVVCDHADVAEKPTPTRPEAFVVVRAPTVMFALSDCAANAGATEVKTPKPREATATSATRLKVVFVDICFLSISRAREFPDLGLNRISPIQFDESHVLIHQILRPIPVETKEFFLLLQHLRRLRQDLGFS
jgi:hypothetical protein